MFDDALLETIDFMSCNKHFMNEINPAFLIEFETQMNTYLKFFKVANDTIARGNADGTVLERLKQRDKEATKMLDLIDSYLEKIFFINPSDIPYNKSDANSPRGLSPSI